MRIVLTHPFCWPHVRRGSERQIEIIAGWLGTRGHDVTFLSTHPKRAQIEPMPYGRRVLARSIPGVPGLRIDERHTFFLTSLRGLKRTDPEIVHSFFYTDSLAASLTRRNRFRTVLQLHGIALPGISCRRYFPPEGLMLRQALERADAVVTCSRFTAGQIEEHYGVQPRIIHSAVDLTSWRLGEGPPDGRPTILAAADFTVRRKGIRPLVKAFSIVKQAHTDAILWLSGRITDELRQQVCSLAGRSAFESIQFLGLGAPEDLARQYQQASLFVLPAMWEPSGGSMMEALASGAPVVAAAHGGLPEYLAPGTSVLFDPRGSGEEVEDIEGLANALMEGIELSRRPGIRERCRAYAERFSANVIGGEFEDLYDSIQ